MYEALASHARQEYPEFEILLGVRDDSDPSIPHIRRLQREFPDVPISLIVGADRAQTAKSACFALSHGTRDTPSG